MADIGDGSEEKCSQAAATLMTLSELVKSVPDSLTEVLRLQGHVKNLLTKFNDKRIRPAMCDLIREVVSKYPEAFAIARPPSPQIIDNQTTQIRINKIETDNLVSLKEAIMTQINDGLTQSGEFSDSYF